MTTTTSTAHNMMLLLARNGTPFFLPPRVNPPVQWPSRIPCCYAPSHGQRGRFTLVVGQRSAAACCKAVRRELSTRQTDLLCLLRLSLLYGWQQQALRKHHPSCRLTRAYHRDRIYRGRISSGISFSSSAASMMNQEVCAGSEALMKPLPHD